MPVYVPGFEVTALAGWLAVAMVWLNALAAALAASTHCLGSLALTAGRARIPGWGILASAIACHIPGICAIVPAWTI